MKSYRSSVVVNQSPAEVFPFLVVREKQALWSDVRMRPLTDGPLRAGSRMELTFGRPPMRATIRLEITALEPERRMAWTSLPGGPIDWTGEYRVEPADGGARVSQAGELRFHGLWRLFEPLVGAEISRNELAELERLKAVAEASTPAAPGMPVT
jgi:hypothetical protein